jgi:hypothetical protein
VGRADEVELLAAVLEFDLEDVEGVEAVVVVEGGRGQQLGVVLGVGPGQIPWLLVIFELH